MGTFKGSLVQDSVNGFIVPEQDSAALARALQRILDNPNLHAQLGQNARRIIAGWDNERMVLGFRQAIEYVTNRG